MEKRYFDFRDIFQVIRYGFSGRKISVHFIGLVLAYLIYESLVYLSLFTLGGDVAIGFWDEFAYLPISPFDIELPLRTEIAMCIGIVIFACIFFLASTVASKITIEQLRGDYFFSVGDALTFLKAHWKSVFGAFIGLLLILMFLVLIPLSIAGLGKLPIVGKPILIVASPFIPIGFFLGLLIALITVVFIVSLFLVPAVVATTGADTFETIYQQFTIVWNEPWRLVCYQILLSALKLIFVPIWAFFCLAGFWIIILPIGYLHPNWFGKFTFEELPVLTQAGLEALTPITAICLLITSMIIIALVLAYLFSIASAGNTIIYTILRKKIDRHDLSVPPDSQFTGSNETQISS